MVRPFVRRPSSAFLPLRGRHALDQNNKKMITECRARLILRGQIQSSTTNNTNTKLHLKRSLTPHPASRTGRALRTMADVVERTLCVFFKTRPSGTRPLDESEPS